MHRFLTMTLLVAAGSLACGGAPPAADPAAETPEPAPAASEASLPVDSPDAVDALLESPRRGEWVDVENPNGGAPVHTWIVYPERTDKAPTVILIAGIRGLNDWTRATADQLAAEGFIALGPDPLSGKGPGGGGYESLETPDDVTRLMRELEADEVDAQLDAVRAYGLALPAASGQDAVIGFCWGGGVSFRFATRPGLDAAIVYYGTAPDADTLAAM